jgi:sugar (pentulose or hexulose) kinase
MAWLAASTPVSRFASPADLVVGKLIGDRAPTDWSHALKSGYDPLRGEWALEAMSALDIDPRLLPEVRRPTEPAGTVCPVAAQSTGLPTGCQVRLGMTDSCASQLAAGAGSPGKFVSVLGSTLVIKGASRELFVDPTGAVYSHRHPDGWWLPGGASSTGGRCLSERFSGRDLRHLDAEAAAFGPAGIVAYPLAGRGERFPFVAPDAEGFALGEPESEIESYRAILEGVVFVERLGYERLSSLGMRIEAPIASTGRGSSSAVWNRIRATAQGRPLLQVAGASTARGACILAAAGTLHRDLASAAAAMAATGVVVEPNPQEADALEASYRRFVDALVDRGWISSASRP